MLTARHGMSRFFPCAKELRCREFYDGKSGGAATLPVCYFSNSLCEHQIENSVLGAALKKHNAANLATNIVHSMFDSVSNKFLRNRQQTSPGM